MLKSSILLIFFLFFAYLDAEGVSNEDEGAKAPSLAEEYVEYLSGGAAGGDDQGGCSAGAGDDGSEGEVGYEDPYGEEGEESNSTANVYSAVATLLTKFRNGFTELDDDEAKEKFKDVQKKIDENNDGYVDREELKKWLLSEGRLSLPYLSKSELMWEPLDTDKNGKLSLDEYMKDFQDYQGDADARLTDDIMQREKDKFKAADQNHDGFLTLDELKMTVYPELFDSMDGFLYNNTLKEMDTNKDGIVNTDECKKMFTENSMDHMSSKCLDLDENKDNILDGDELKKLIMIYNIDVLLNLEDEVLFNKVDTNKDGKLSAQEMLDGMQLFTVDAVESETTNAASQTDEIKDPLKVVKDDGLSKQETQDKEEKDEL